MRLLQIGLAHARVPGRGKERLVVLLCLVGMSAAAWLWLSAMAARVAPASDMPMPQLSTTREAWAILLMWIVMMVGMMLPGAAPMIVLFTTINRRKRAAGQPFVSTGIFILGYLIVWAAFCAAATVFQLGLHALARLLPGVEGTSTIFGAAALVAAGVYQWTPLKFVCLKHCRSPLHFILASWREGAAGALQMRLKHGAYCLGCCWMLMALMFVGGTMNLLWAAAIAAVVLAEKALPRGLLIARASGLALIVAGCGVLASS